MQAKVRYTKQQDNGSFKRVNELYLLAAMSWTDAEARVYEELGSMIRGEFTIQDISRFNIHDIFAYDDADVWYKAKVTYMGLDSDSDKEKKVTQYFLVTANSVKEADERIKESLSTLLVDFEIKSLVETKIIEIFPYKDEELQDKEVDRRPIAEGEDVSKMEKMS